MRQARPEIALGLLCGGRGRRMGVAKEALVDAGGRTLLEFQTSRLAPHFSECLLLCGPSHKPALARTRPIVDPEEFQGLGPLAGLLAGLSEMTSDWLALMPIDCPNFPHRVFKAALEQVSSGIEFVGFLDHDGRQQWLPGLYRATMASRVRGALLARELSLGRFVGTLGHIYLPWTDSEVHSEHAFANLNTREEAAAAGFRLPES